MIGRSMSFPPFFKGTTVGYCKIFTLIKRLKYPIYEKLLFTPTNPTYRVCRVIILLLYYMFILYLKWASERKE